MNIFPKLKANFVAILALLCLIFFAIPGSSNALEAGMTPPPLGARYTSGEVLVKLKATAVSQAMLSATTTLSLSTLPASIDTINKKYGISKFEPIVRPRPPKKGKMIIMATDADSDRFRVYKVSFPKNKNVMDVVKDYALDPNVEVVEPNLLRFTDTTPNDPKYADKTCWGPWKIRLTEVGSADSGWNFTKGNTGVKIAIVDTGVDYNHPDIKDNIWVNPGEDWNHDGKFTFAPTPEGDLNGMDDDGNGQTDDIIGFDFVNATYPIYPGEDGLEPDNNPMDFHGHGTHCSGIASAVTDNMTGIAGVGWNCKIMAVRAGYAYSSGGGVLELADIFAAICYAADNGADVISMSFGGSSGSSFESGAVDYAVSKGVVLVASAGNADSSTVMYPASYDNVIAVVSTDQYDNRSGFSSYGTWTDVCAPGSSIYSTLPTTNLWYPGSTYGYLNGTSMACPHVAGLAGLIKSRFPTYTRDQIRAQIENNCDNIDALNPSYAGMLGHGRINAFRALSATSSNPITLKDRLSGNTNYTRSTIISVEVAVGSTPDEMIVSSESTFAGSSWVPFAASFTFEVTAAEGSEEIKTVYFKSKKSGVPSSVESASIILDTILPQVNSLLLKDTTNKSPVFTNERLVTVEVAAYDQNGVSEMQFSEDPSFTGATWESFRTRFNYLLSSSLGTKEVYIRARDTAGNIGLAASAETFYDPYAIELSGIVLKDRTSSSEVYSNERTIEVLALGAVGSYEALMMKISESSTFEGASWRKFVNPASFEITSPGSNSVSKEVYYYFWDTERGFTSEVRSDKIILDTVPPAVSAIQPSPPGATNVSVFNRIQISFNDTMLITNCAISVSPELNLSNPVWSSNNSILTFDNFKALKTCIPFNTRYTITFEGMDKAENPLVKYTWSFLTEPPCTIEGYILNGFVGMPNVSVEVAQNHTGHTMFLKSATTDNSGYYRMDRLPHGTFEVEPLALGWEIKTSAGYLGYGETKSNINVTLESHAWPQWNGNRMHIQVMPYGSLEAGDIKLKWSYINHAGGFTRSSPVVAYGNVYAALSTEVFCFDGRTGSIEWRQPWTLNNAGAPAVANRKVFFNNYGAGVSAYDAITGTKLWGLSVTNNAMDMLSTLYATGALYTFTTSGGRHSAFNPQSGASFWAAGVVGGNDTTTGAIGGGSIYIPLIGDRLGAFTQDNLSLIWTSENLVNLYYGKASPVISGNNIIFANNVGTIYCFNRDDHSLKWTYTGVADYVGTPVVYEGVVYTAGHGRIIAISEADGSELWSASEPGIGGGSTPVLCNNALYFLDGSDIYGFDLGERKVKLKYRIPESNYNTVPAVCDDMLYITTNTQDLYAFGPSLPPNAPSNLLQYRLWSGSSLEAEGNTDLCRVSLITKASDPDMYGTLYAELEVRPTNEAFTDTPNVTSEIKSHTTSEVTISVTGLRLLNNTDYHWQARVRDDKDKVGGWTQFNSGNKAFGVRDNISPEVVSTSPASNETNVSGLSLIYLRFSEPMDLAGLQDNLKISPDIPGALQPSASVTTEFVFTPASRLLGATLYTVTIEAGASDEVGNPLGRDFSFTFETTSAGAYSGYVSLSGFGGLPGATVDFALNGKTLISTTTDPSGLYSVKDIPEQTYNIQVLKSGYSLRNAFNIPVTAETQGRLDFTVTPGWSMTLQDRSNTKHSSDSSLSPPLRLKWSFYAPPDATYGNTIWTTPAIDNGRAYFGSANGYAYAVDLSSGALVWTHRPGLNTRTLMAPATMNNTVYFGVYQRLFALDQATGTFLWSRNGESGKYASNGSVINNGLLYEPFSDLLYCFNLDSKTIKWSYRNPYGYSLVTPPCAYKNLVYFVAGPSLIALDPESRTVRWSYDLDDYSYEPSSPPAAYDDRVYVGSPMSTFYCFNYLDGSIAWTYTAPAYQQIMSSPLHYDGKVFFTGTDTLFALNASNGSFLWTRYLGGFVAPVTSSPIMVNGNIYLGGSAYGVTEEVLCISPADGAILWSYATPLGNPSAASSAQGILLFAGEDGVLRAFENGVGGDTTPPEITVAPQALNITTCEATITWQTNELSNSILDYGLTDSYGDALALSDFTLSHIFTIEGMLDGTTYHYRVGSRDPSGNGPTYSGDRTFTTLTIPGKDYSKPLISVLVNGSRILSGDFINPRPVISATITDNTTLDVSSFNFMIDETTIEAYALTTIEAWKTYAVHYTVSTPLATDDIRKHSITMRVKDTTSNEGVWGKLDLSVTSSKVAKVLNPLAYPAVFRPLKGGMATFAYNLTGDSDIVFLLYDTSGKIVLTRKFRSGNPGGKAGYNSFEWTGKTLYGHVVGNGVYVYKITSGNRLLGRGTIVVND